jgi:hypothetical protein
LSAEVTRYDSGVRPPPKLEAAKDALYAVNLGDFAKERTRLAAELKAAGDAASARVVATLPKPTVSAWAVNRLWRRHRKDFDALLAAGETMRGAGDPDAFREATAGQRDALATMRQHAESALREAGHAATEATLRRVTTTLTALAAAGSFDPDLPGSLVADRDPPGFEAMTGAASALSADKPKRAAPAAKAAPPEDDRAKKHAAELAAATHALADTVDLRHRAEADAKARAADVTRARDALDVAIRARTEADLALERAERAEREAERALAQRKGRGHTK